MSLIARTSICLLLAAIAVTSGCAETPAEPDSSSESDQATDTSTADDSSELDESDQDTETDTADDSQEDDSGNEPGGCANPPIAILSLYECDATASPPLISDCVPPGTIEPLSRVYFDSSESYDPSGGSLVAYLWEVIAQPQGANPDDFDLFADGPIGSLTVPISGQYTVRLTVTNDLGCPSEHLPDSELTFSATPMDMLHVQLVWDHPSNDQDLYLTHTSGTAEPCSDDLDCYYGNQSPIWFDSHPAGEGPNPRLNIDDTGGLGPETISIENPESGTYLVSARYYANPISTPTVDTLRIFIGGTLRFAEQRTLTAPLQVWSAAEIVWSTGPDDVEINPCPSSDGGVGSVTESGDDDCQ